MKQFLVSLPVIGKKLFVKLFTKIENGEKESKTLRDYVLRKYNVSVDLYTYGSCFRPGFNVGGSVEIGKYCSFGPNVTYFGANHPVNHAIMSAYFYNKDFSGLNVDDVPRHKLIIGNDVWIGGNVNITPSCKYIGNGAVIATGAAVTKDVPAYAIVGGVPARILRYRFDPQTIEMLEKCNWYDLTPDKLMEFYELIDNPVCFSEKVIKYWKGRDNE